MCIAFPRLPFLTSVFHSGLPATFDLFDPCLLLSAMPPLTILSSPFPYSVLPVSHGHLTDIVLSLVSLHAVIFPSQGKISHHHSGKILSF